MQILKKQLSSQDNLTPHNTARDTQLFRQKASHSFRAS